MLILLSKLNATLNGIANNLIAFNNCQEWKMAYFVFVQGKFI